MQKAQQDLKDFGGKMKSAMGTLAAALGGIAIGAGIKDAVDDALKVEASMQQINRTMGSSGKEFAEWAKTSAGAFNMSRSEAIRYGAIFSNLISTFASDTTEISTHTKSLLKASSVISAATGRDIGDVMERIRSGMLGNTEAIEDLGVNVQVSMMESTEAFKKFAKGKSWDQLDFKTKQQIMLFGILEQATKKYGDELAQNTASRIGEFTTKLKDARLSLGQAFLPIINVILPTLKAFANGLARTMSVLAQFSQAIFGRSFVSQAKATDAQAAAVGNLGDAYDETGKKAKKAANSLAGFDEINSLGSGSGANDPAAAAGGGAPVDLGMGGIGEATDEVSSKVQAMADKVKTAFGEMSSFITQHKEVIIAALGGIAAAFATLAIIRGVSLLFQGIGAAIALILSPIGLLVIGLAALAAAFIYLWRNNEEFRTGVLAVWENIKTGLATAWQWISDQAIVIWDGMKAFWKKHGDDIKTEFNTAWNGIKLVLNGLWNAISEIGMSIWNGLKEFWKNHGKEVEGLLSGTWNVIQSALSTTWNLIKGVATAIFGALSSFWKTHGEDVKKHVSGIWETAWVIIKPIWETFNSLARSIFDGLKQFWKEWGPDVQDFLESAFTLAWTIIKKVWDDFDSIARSIFGGLSKFWDSWGGTIQKVFSHMWDVILDTVGTAFKIMSEIFKLLTDAISGNWSGVWEHIKNIGKAVWEWLIKTVGNFSGAFTAIFDKLSDILYDIWIDIWNYIKGIVNKIITMVNNMIDVINSVGSKVGISINKIPELTMSLDTEGLRQKKESEDLIAQKTKEAANEFETRSAQIDSALSSGDITAAIAAQQKALLDAMKTSMDASIAEYKKTIASIGKPMLARGGIVDGATNMGNYIAGEAGAEMIVPLENTSFVDKVASALGTAVLTAMQMGSKGNGNQGVSDIIIDGVKLARAIAPYLDKENSRSGGAMITTT